MTAALLVALVVAAVLGPRWIEGTTPRWFSELSKAGKETGVAAWESVRTEAIKAAKDLGKWAFGGATVGAVALIGGGTAVAVTQPQLVENVLERFDGDTIYDSPWRPEIVRPEPHITGPNGHAIDLSADLIAGRSGGRARTNTAVVQVAGTPTAPTVAFTVMSGDTAGYATTGTFSELGDSLEYVIYEVDSLRGDFTTAPLLVDTQTEASGRAYRSDTIFTLTADDTFKVRALHRGFEGGNSAYSTVDTFVAASLIFEMDYSAGAFPEAGFDSYADTGRYCYTLQRIASGGPGNRPYYRFFNHDSAVATGGYCNEPYMGGWDVVTGHEFEYGDTFYMRGRMRFEAPLDCSSNGQQHGGKYVMWNDGGDPNTQRVMMSTECYEGEAPGNRIVLGIMRSNGSQFCYSNGAYQYPTTENNFTHDEGVWIDWQMRIGFSSAFNEPDGHFAFWIDGDNSDESTPTCEVNSANLVGTVHEPDTAVVVNVTPGDDGRFGLGYYYNYPADQVNGDSAIHNLADFEISLDFDPTWGN